ncbi:baculoviral IAP repeat-containing protein 5b isoform X1 [Thalassophryne amazonica]|uniref:baculoviral IAP repeat-containing protein 5b isoform X1 n=1 Tax=Thalassophryne amazonica TaxID=390379 RepID=UPI001470D700|nr:baculoviral IAP repeat-containing protein 5b isoform X1 [Thalassophryne amazonica]
MASVDVLSTRFYSYDKMYMYDLREQSFAEWPFRQDCKCTPENMAKAGFVHCPSENEPDVACCFFCLIELEGWEPDDDPWSEHIKRSPNCGFLTMNKDFTELTVAEFYTMEKERLKIYIVSISVLRKCLFKLMSHICFCNRERHAIRRWHICGTNLTIH